MTEIEQAIETIKKISDLDVKLHLNIRQYDLLTAIEVLKEKAEREKGCELCNNKGMKQYAISLGHQYCPGCGRKLVSEESHDS